VDIHIHYTIEFGENTLLVALFVLGLVALWMVYTTTAEPVLPPEPVLTPEPVLPPEPPKGQIGFRPNQCD